MYYRKLIIGNAYALANGENWSGASGKWSGTKLILVKVETPDHCTYKCFVRHPDGETRYFYSFMLRPWATTPR